MSGTSIKSPSELPKVGLSEITRDPVGEAHWRRQPPEPVTLTLAKISRRRMSRERHVARPGKWAAGTEDPILVCADRYRSLRLAALVAAINRQAFELSKEYKYSALNEASCRPPTSKDP